MPGWSSMTRVAHKGVGSSPDRANSSCPIPPSNNVILAMSLSCFFPNHLRRMPEVAFPIGVFNMQAHHASGAFAIVLHC